ncbi:hypothetical protein GGH92_001091 [Coemansia sp. RSA 2673]|nr:hypothetical protein GGH92_001091 [Coemansia sp. RSA 2673]
MMMTMTAGEQALACHAHRPLIRPGLQLTGFGGRTDAEACYLCLGQQPLPRHGQWAVMQVGQYQFRPSRPPG